jgi:excisionase family DNA binding protein
VYHFTVKASQGYITSMIPLVSRAVPHAMRAAALGTGHKRLHAPLSVANWKHHHTEANMEANATQKTISIRAAAYRFGLTERTLLDWARSGKVTAYKPGKRILLDLPELEGLIRNSRVSAAAAATA